MAHVVCGGNITICLNPAVHLMSTVSQHLWWPACGPASRKSLISFGYIFYFCERNVLCLAFTHNAYTAHLPHSSFLQYSMLLMDNSTFLIQTHFTTVSARLQYVAWRQSIWAHSLGSSKPSCSFYNVLAVRCGEIYWICFRNCLRFFL